jgi:ubiquinone/menaquinone biosynthesis C-methylase UbiE
VLEIGGGRGVAAGLICERLTGRGTYTGLDRSAIATRAARERNRDAIATGRVTFETAALSEADLPARTFDKVLAVNVNLFWLDAATELTVLRRALESNGILCLVYEPPSPDKARDISRRVQSNLEAAGFEVMDRFDRVIGAASRGLAVLARVAANSSVS